MAVALIIVEFLEKILERPGTRHQHRIPAINVMPKKGRLISPLAHRSSSCRVIVIECVLSHDDEVMFNELGYCIAGHYVL